ncbi:MAG: hypothetical protein ACYS99_21275 [Planctomycetota bacterium]
MSERSPIDEIHALAAGSLSSEEEARLRERCAADPGLQALLESYLEAYALTESADVEPPPCRTTFEEVVGTYVPQRAWRMVLRRHWRVAAAVLVLVVGAYALSHALPGGEAGREPLALAAIPLREMPEDETGVEVPDLAADYRPVEGGEIRWIDSLETAKAMARVSSRPVLLFIHHPTCPACLEMRDDAFRDSEVLGPVDGFVPAMVSVLNEDDFTKPLAELLRDGWPWSGAVDPEGRVILSFPGLQGAGDFSANLKEAARLAGPSVLAWDRVNELARRYFDARKVESAIPGRAYELYAALADDAAGEIRTAAEDGTTRIANRARETLIRIRYLAERSEIPIGVVAALEKAVEEFTGSPFADDFRTVLARLERHGSFPPIAGVE